jgi:hypothetical protein
MGKRKRRKSSWFGKNLEPGVVRGNQRCEAPKDRQDATRDGMWERRSGGTIVRRPHPNSSFGYAKH